MEFFQTTKLKRMFNIDEELKKYLPLFVANCYTCKDFTEKEIIMKSGDKGTIYQEDREFLEDCFLWCCLTDKNKCISEFDKCYNKEKALIEWIKVNEIKVLNSGIKIA